MGKKEKIKEEKKKGVTLSIFHIPHAEIDLSPDWMLQ